MPISSDPKSGSDAEGGDASFGAEPRLRQSAPDRPVAPLANPRIGMGANDGPVDDFIHLVERWEEIAGSGLMPGFAGAHGADDASAPGSSGANAGEISADELRRIAAQLCKLADRLDEASITAVPETGSDITSRFAEIERHADQLAQAAKALRAAGHRRTRHLSPEFFGEPAWEMLLELFVHFAGGTLISTKSLLFASGVPETTAHRWIDRLDDACLIERTPSAADRRVTLIGLSRQGVIAVGSVLLEMDRG